VRLQTIFQFGRSDLHKEHQVFDFQIKRP